MHRVVNVARDLHLRGERPLFESLFESLFHGLTDGLNSRGSSPRATSSKAAWARHLPCVSREAQAVAALASPVPTP